MNKIQMDEMKRQGRAMGQILGSVQEELEATHPSLVKIGDSAVIIAPNGNMILLTDLGETQNQNWRQRQYEEEQRREEIEDREKDALFNQQLATIPLFNSLNANSLSEDLDAKKKKKHKKKHKKH